jgi:phosphoribosylformimino-5-aminoimidazole carboxamide ribotide isomerase
MTKFRPCIDLHNGKVKQIVGGTLTDSGAGLKENFVSDRDAAVFAQMYANDNLIGGHVIQLGPGNQAAAESAILAYPQGLQIGGGITIENAVKWLELGASHVIVTSWLFDSNAQFQWERIKALQAEVGKKHIVVDLSCRKTSSGWTVAMNRWQTLTNIMITHSILDAIAPFCDEFLIHAADVEGLCNGVDGELVEYLGQWGKIPMTYAGGVGTMKDVNEVAVRSCGALDLTVGSALDIFGGIGVRYQQLVDRNQSKL